jgi:hypothetical protein
MFISHKKGNTFFHWCSISLSVLKDWFKHMKELKTLKLIKMSYNTSDLSLLDSCFFADLVNLESLIITDYEFFMGKLSKNFLKGLYNLKSLAIYEVYYIEPNAFDDLINLEILDLSRNRRLDSIPSNLFEKLNNLTYVNLTNVWLNQDMHTLFEKNTKLEKIHCA